MELIIQLYTNAVFKRFLFPFFTEKQSTLSFKPSSNTKKSKKKFGSDSESEDDVKIEDFSDDSDGDNNDDGDDAEYVPRATKTRTAKPVGLNCV